jgi:hypothetical protein
MDWKDTVKQLAPTVASALGGPLAGVAVEALGSIFGVSQPTQDKIADVIANSQITPDHIAEIKKLEMQYKNDEQERGFRYAELAFKDRDSARTANVSGGIQGRLFVLSIVLLVLTLGTEVWVLFNGYPSTIPDIIVGRVLGLMDAVAMMVLAYYYGTSSGSAQKTEIMARK